MGWKAACILVSEREPGYLGALPQHDPVAAHDLIVRLGLGSCPSLRLTDFDYGVYPESGRFVIGAYNGAAIVAGQDLVFGMVIGEKGDVLRQLLELFPAAEILVIELHSAVNYFGYAYYRGQELQRAYAGSAEDGVLVERGELQPEEQDYFAHSEVRDGMRYFDLDGETWTVDQIGEILVFAMASKFLGKPLNQLSLKNLTVEELEERPA